MIDDELGTNSDELDKPDESKAITGFSTSSLSRAPLSGAQKRYQSRAFNANIAVNPLIATASPIFSLASRLRNQQQSPDLKELHEQLSHEIKAFENKAQSQGYRSQVILAARYLLCALLDETILRTTWGKDSEWEQHNLLKTFQREQWGGERFFLILERSAEDANLYIDLLELGYLCLSLGFQGKYHDSQDYHQLAMVIDNLYDLIRHQRGESSKRLLSSPVKPASSNKHRWQLPPLWLTVTLGVIALAAIFVPYYYRLNQHSENIKKVIHNITQPKESPYVR